MRQRDGIWQEDAPVRDRADSGVISQLLSAAAGLQKDGLIEGGDKAALNDYDVTNPGVRLKLTGKDAPPEILFGKDAAVEGKMYLRTAGSDTVFVASNVLKNMVMKKGDDFRDHHLTDFPAQQVCKLAIKNPDGEIELERSRDHWQLNKPIHARADDQKTGDLVAQIINARIAGFIADKDASAASTGLGEPRGTVTLFAEGKDNPAVLQIGQPAETDGIYAHFLPRDLICLLPKTVAAALAIQPNDLRDRHLVRLNLDMVDRIHIEPAAGPKIILARSREDWTLKSEANRPANGDEVRRLANLLQTQPVAAFVEDVASDLAKYGLDHPQLQVTFSSYASENTAETQAGEHPIATISFGKTDGNRVFARLEDEPFVVSVGKDMLNNIFSDPVQWRTPSVFQFKPEEITAITVDREGRQPLSFSRGEKGGWKLASGEGHLNEITVQSLCNTLATLRAVRWTGSTTNGLGFETPAVTISFTTSGKRNVRLVLGSITPGSMWNAMTDATNGTFVLSRPDVETMQADFVTK